MTTQYTPILKLALPVQGELSGTWGDVVNDNITSMIEQAIAGRSVVNTWSGNSHTLTTANGTTAEARAAMLSLTDTGTQLSAAGTVVCPALSKTYIVKNGAGQVITVKTASGSGIAIPNGKTMLVYCDGTNVLEGVDHVVTLSAGTLTITGLTTFASLKGADATTVTGILDEDNMASNSATKLATQQSIKAYVDAQVDTTDTLAEILAIGNTTGSNDIDVDAAQKVQFRDASIYINSSADGQLDIVADTEIQIATATVDLNGNLDVSGTALVTGTLDVDGATQLDSTLTVGVNDTGHDVKFFGATSGSYMLWDESADDLILGGAAGLTIAGDIDVDGTTNLDVVDIDGAVDMATTLGVTGVATLASLVATTADINGGTIDGTIIGGTTTAAISGTTGQFGTSLNVDGTATMDGLTVDGTSTIATFLRDAGANGSLALTFPAQTTTLTSLSGFKINANSADRFNIASNGDISFYEDTGTTPKFFWDASAESLGIGTSAPAARLHVNGGRSTFYSGDNYAVGVGNAAGVLGGYMGSPSVNVLTFSEPGGLERMRLDAAGDLTVKVGNLVIGTSGKGIDFSANGNAGGMTSELLDDYEEGTWTPVLTPHSGTAPTTSTTNSGSYTKVGRLVTVIGFIQIDAISGVTSGVVNISLPFTPVSTAGYMPSGPVTPNGMNFTRPDIVTITIYSGATAGFLTANNAGGWDWETFSIFSAADALRFSLSFNTA